MMGEVHRVDQSTRILQKTGEDFRRIGRPEATVSRSEGNLCFF